MSLRDRLRESAKGRDQRGGGKRQLLDLSRAGRVVPLTEIKEGREANKWDILPWKVTQPWYPKLRGFNGKTMGELGLGVGKTDYKLEVPRHKITANGATIMVVCLREAFGDKCAICDDMFEMYRNAQSEQDKSNARKLQCSWRDFYNVFDLNQEDDPQVISIAEVAYHDLEIRLLEAVTTGSEDHMDFADLQIGETLIFTGHNKPIGKNNHIEPEGLRFSKREPWDEATVFDPNHGVFSLDALIPIPTVEEVTRMYLDLEQDDIPEPGSGSPGNMPEAKRPEPPAASAPPARRRVFPVPAQVAPASQPARRLSTAPAPAQTAPPVEVQVVIECPVGHFGEAGGYQECDNCIQECYDACVAKLDGQRTEAGETVSQPEEKPIQELPKSAPPVQAPPPAPAGGFTRRRTNR